MEDLRNGWEVQEFVFLFFFFSLFWINQAPFYDCVTQDTCERSDRLLGHGGKRVLTDVQSKGNELEKSTKGSPGVLKTTGRIAFT